MYMMKIVTIDVYKDIVENSLRYLTFFEIKE
jgi:hypothetical protein